MPKLVTRLSMVGFCLAAAAFAATMPDFSGDYAAQPKKNSKSTVTPAVLRVVQTDVAIEVTRRAGEKPFTNRFPLDGGEGDYTTETGVRGKCKAQLKNDTLVLESFVVSRPDDNGGITQSASTLSSNGGCPPTRKR